MSVTSRLEMPDHDTRVAKRVEMVKGKPAEMAQVDVVLETVEGMNNKQLNYNLYEAMFNTDQTDVRNRAIHMMAVGSFNDKKFMEDSLIMLKETRQMIKRKNGQSDFSVLMDKQLKLMNSLYTTQVNYPVKRKEIAETPNGGAKKFYKIVLGDGESLQSNEDVKRLISQMMDPKSRTDEVELKDLKKLAIQIKAANRRRSVQLPSELIQMLEDQHANNSPSADVKFRYEGSISRNSTSNHLKDTKRFPGSKNNKVDSDSSKDNESKEDLPSNLPSPQKYFSLAANSNQANIEQSHSLIKPINDARDMFQQDLEKVWTRNCFAHEGYERFGKRLYVNSHSSNSNYIKETVPFAVEVMKRRLRKFEKSMEKNLAVTEKLEKSARAAQLSKDKERRDKKEQLKKGSNSFGKPMNALQNLNHTKTLPEKPKPVKKSQARNQLEDLKKLLTSEMPEPNSRSIHTSTSSEGKSYSIDEIKEASHQIDGRHARQSLNMQERSLPARNVSLAKVQRNGDGQRNYLLKSGNMKSLRRNFHNKSTSLYASNFASTTAANSQHANPNEKIKMLHMENPHSQFFVLETLNLKDNTIPEIVIKKKLVPPIKNGVLQTILSIPEQSNVSQVFTDRESKLPVHSRNLAPATLRSLREGESRTHRYSQSHIPKTLLPIQQPGIRELHEKLYDQILANDDQKQAKSMKKAVNKTIQANTKFKKRYNNLEYLDIFRDDCTEAEPIEIMDKAMEIYKHSTSNFKKKVLMLTVGGCKKGPLFPQMKNGEIIYD